MTTKPKKRRELGLDKEALFAYLGYQPHPGQSEVHRSIAKRRVVACGTRFGKSTLGVFECVAALLHPRDRAMGWLIAPQYTLCNRIFLRVVETVQSRMPHRIASLDSRGRSIKVVNLSGGVSELHAKSADRPVGLLGEALDFCVLDESAHLRDDVWDEHVSPRLIDRNGWSLMLSTPNGPGLFYDEFLRGRSDPDYACFQYPTSANPLISQELIEAERKRLDPNLFRANYLAEFVGVPVLACPTCHGPTPNTRTFVIMIDGEDELGTCPACGRLTDDEGECLVPLRKDGTEGEPRIVRIIPDRGATEPPELP
ncbi:MAG: hypothetical protein ABL886_04930 [Rhodoglobus sp.]